MKFSIITPSFNSGELIRDTIESVVTQIRTNGIDIEYIIIDGGSTDQSLKFIKEYSSKYNFIKFISEKDNGMYDAICKGLDLISGDITSYINAGDIYNKNALTTLSEIFKNKKINWLTGYKFLYNENSEVIKVSTPYKYRARLIQSGFYGKYLPFIQQESTFWRSELNKYINKNYFKKLKLSGDYYIWYTFSKKYKLDIVQTHLGGFKIHAGQLSSTKIAGKYGYKDEMKKFIKKKRFFDFIVFFIDLMPWLILRYSNYIFGSIFSDHITFNLNQKEWEASSINKEDYIYCWASDLSLNRGEGKLSKKFILDKFLHKNIIIRTNFKIHTFRNISNLSFLKNLKIFTKKKIKLNFFESYISPIMGLLWLWLLFLRKKKICYINFLPLWNIFLIAFLPPGTIFGPITGSVYKGKVRNLNTLIRKYILPILYHLSSKILLFRKSNFIFSTSLLKNYIPNKLKALSKFNYIFDKLTINSYNFDKDIQCVIYFRKYETKSNSFFEKLINKLSESEISFCYFGDKIKNQNKNYLGILSNEEVNKILCRSQFTFASEENFNSFFIYESIKNNLNIFYSKKIAENIDEKFKNSKKIIPLNYEDNIESNFKIIKSVIYNFKKSYDMSYIFEINDI